MNKCVTERPRRGWRIKYCKGEKREWNRMDAEEYPKREKIRLKWCKGWNDGKEFTDVLGPIYGYIHSKVGQKWDDVYSEICHKLPKRSLQGIHIHDHINWIVEKNVIMIDGKPCHATYPVGAKITSEKYRQEYYVHPETGILCQAPVREHYRPKPKLKSTIFDNKHYQKIKNIWYEVTLLPTNKVPITPSKARWNGHQYRYYDKATGNG